MVSIKTTAHSAPQNEPSKKLLVSEFFFIFFLEVVKRNKNYKITCLLYHTVNSVKHFLFPSTLYGAINDTTKKKKPSYSYVFEIMKTLWLLEGGFGGNKNGPVLKRLKPCTLVGLYALFLRVGTFY